MTSQAWRYAALGRPDSGGGGGGGYAPCSLDAGVDRIVSLIKAFNGDVAGPVLHHAVRGERVTRAHAVARVPPELTAYFLAVLAVDHQVRAAAPEQCPPASSAGRVLDVACRGPLQGAAGVTLTLETCCRAAWRCRPCDFDCDLLAANAGSVYLLRDGGELSHACVDRVGFVLSRVRDRRFSALQRGGGGGGGGGGGVAAAGLSASDAAAGVARVQRAAQLLDGGWTMDDVVSGPRGWVVARHDALAVPLASAVRLASPAPAGSATHVNDTCALCHEGFRADDRVLQLGCRHAFHLACGGVGGVGGRGVAATTGAGILTWMAQGHAACPVCRQVTVV